MTTPHEATIQLFPGDEAPTFLLPAFPDGEIALAEYKHKKNVVLAFYYDDSSSTSAHELKRLSAAVPELCELGTVVLAVSCNTMDEHERFAKNNELSVTLLSDVGGVVARSYGALWGDNPKPDTLVLLIDKEGVVQDVLQQIPDAQALMQKIRQLG